MLAQSERRAPGRSIKLLITCVPRPPYYDGACERVCSRRRSTFIDRLLAYTCFVKENAPKILHCNAGKNFCALDNDENSTINTRAERFPAPRLSCFITRRNYTRSKVSSCSGALYQAIRLEGCSLKGCIVLVEENKLPSSDMGVLLSPLLRVRARVSS